MDSFGKVRRQGGKRKITERMGRDRANMSVSLFPVSLFTAHLLWLVGIDLKPLRVHSSMRELHTPGINWERLEYEEG